MGIERIVTDAMVFEIADSLAANGEKVTNRAIWSAIGGGSMTTISQALRHWKEQQEIQVSQPIERAPLPASVLDVLHQAAAQLWETAQAETKAELEQLAQATNARIAEAHAERDDTLAELQATAEELEQVRAERDTAQAEIDNQAKQLATNAEQIAALNTQTIATTEAAHRAEIVEAIRVELQARAEQLTSLLEHEQAARLAESKQAKAEATANAQQLTKARKEAENARIAEQACQSRLEASAREIEALKAQIKEERSEAKKSAELAAELKGQLLIFGEVSSDPEPATPKAPRKTKQAKVN